MTMMINIITGTRIFEKNRAINFVMLNVYVSCPEADINSDKLS